MENNHTPIGKTNWRNENRTFYIKDFDRLGHMYVVGKTGVGKSTLLLNMAISDIEKGKGICVIDPHGDISEAILDRIPKDRIDDVIYFNPKDIDFPIGFNPLKGVHPQFHHLVTSGLISTFKKIWSESWGPRLEYILRFSILTLLELPDATLLDIQPLLTNQKFRNHCLNFVTNPHTIAFWRDEFEKYNNVFRTEAITPILNKTGVFLTSSILRNIVGQPTRSFRMQSVMDTKKIFIANLSKGEIGEDVASILGSIILTSIQLAATYRASIKEEERIPFYVYIDEMHSFVTLSFIDILAEARKYKLSLFLTHQYIDQIPEKIRQAIFGNIGTMISFRIGASDATFLEKEFFPQFSIFDLVHLPKYSMYLKLMIDGATSQPFSAISLAPSLILQSFKKEIISRSRHYYGKEKHKVENQIFKRFDFESKQEKTGNLFDTA